MNQHDRLIIENGLNNCFSFKAITLKLGKDCTTISKEVRTNMVHCDISYYGRVFNSCIHRSSCIKEDVCDTCHLSKSICCHSFNFCRDECQNSLKKSVPDFLSLLMHVMDAKISKSLLLLNKCILLYRQINNIWKDYLNLDLASLLMKP